MEATADDEIREVSGGAGRSKLDAVGNVKTAACPVEVRRSDPSQVEDFTKDRFSTVGIGRPSGVFGVRLALAETGPPPVVD